MESKSHHRSSEYFYDKTRSEKLLVSRISTDHIPDPHTQLLSRKFLDEVAKLLNPIEKNEVGGTRAQGYEETQRNPYNRDSLSTANKVADGIQVCVATDLQCFRLRRLCELLDECARTCDQSRIVFNSGVEYPSMVVKPKNAGRLCTYSSDTPGAPLSQAEPAKTFGLAAASYESTPESGLGCSAVVDGSSATPSKFF